MASKCRLVLVALATLLLAASPGAAADRYIRYQLIEPDVSTIGKVLMQPHIYTGGGGYSVPMNWTGHELPGSIAYSGMYVPPDRWSDWYELPPEPLWGTIDLQLTGGKPIEAVTVRIQVASPIAEERFIIADMTTSSETGSKVGFMLPANLLGNRELIEPLKQGLARRKRVAEAAAPPETHRPKLLMFDPCAAHDDPTIKDSQRQELEIVRTLGFNCVDIAFPQASPWFAYRSLHSTGKDIERDRQRKAAYEQRYEGEPPPIAYAMMVDEPSVLTGFRPMWAETGEQGFREYLTEQGLEAAFFGKASFDEVNYIPHDQPVAADAPIEQRRLWYWSSRYMHFACAVYFKQLSDRTHETFPDTLTTVNYSDHGIILNRGMIANHLPDFFQFGRVGALDMYFTEDWMFHSLDSWGNGLWQRVAYLTDLLRAAGRYHHQPHPVTGNYVIPNGFAPLKEGTDHSVPARVNLLLGRGSKLFGFFTYGPTARGTIDFWGDNAPAMRGVGDATGMVGQPDIEPLLHAGYPATSQACLLYGTAAERWQNANNANACNQEKQYTYMMVQQEQVQLEIIDAFDLERFIDDFRAAILIDWNLRRDSAAALRAWVEAGGVLLLWPNAASRDEYNEPFDAFPEAAEPGAFDIGEGKVVRLDGMPGHAWWSATRSASRAARNNWASHFDDAHRGKVVDLLLETGGVERPITVSEAAVVANALISDGGVAVPLVNLRGLRDEAEGGTRYDSVTVTLADGEGIRTAMSSRHGELELQRSGDAVSVSLPLEATDVVVFKP